MIEILIGQLILTAGQWKQYGEKKYSERFNLLLKRLQVAAGVTHEGAVRLVLGEINKGVPAAM